jgi:uncharacterized membrane protein
MMGYLKIILNIIDKQKARFSDILSCFHLFFKLLFGYILYTLILLLGFVFLISGVIFVFTNPALTQYVYGLKGASPPEVLKMIFMFGFIIFLLSLPAIVWSIKFGFYNMFIVDKETGAVEALRESSRITDGYKWQIFLFGIVIMLFNFLGMLTFIVGLLITIPTSGIAYVVLYRTLYDIAKEEEPTEEPALQYLIGEELEEPLAPVDPVLNAEEDYE